MFYTGGVIMPEIRLIKDLRNTNEISEFCHERNDPIYITKNGYGHLVVMSMETYKKKLAKAELYEKLAEAERDLNKEDELLDAEVVFERIKKKYGRE